MSSGRVGLTAVTWKGHNSPMKKRRTPLPAVDFTACACSGVNLPKLVQPLILAALSKEPLHGYALAQRLYRPISQLIDVNVDLQIARASLSRASSARMHRRNSPLSSTAKNASRHCKKKKRACWKKWARAEKASLPRGGLRLIGWQRKLKSNCRTSGWNGRVLVYPSNTAKTRRVRQSMEPGWRSIRPGLIGWSFSSRRIREKD